MVNAVDSSELAKIEPSPSIRVLYLEAATDLRDLASLRFLTNPQEIRLIRYDRLSLAGIERWENSLQLLSLRECKLTDLTPLASLKMLAEIDLKGTVVTDVGPLLALPSLRCLTVDSLRSARDLHQLRKMRSLRELRIGVGGLVDLAGLAGMKDLTIKVQLSTPTRGGHLLDPSVTLQKLDMI
jgi:Leucine-rich repeat (LRR) protein